MSNLNEQQFNQGTLFVPLSTIINDYDKADAVGHTSGEADEWSPKDQWERPNSKYFSLRDIKLGDKRNLRKGMTYEKMLNTDTKDLPKSDPRFVSEFGPVKPPVIHHNFGQARPMMTDGHHRVAHLEAKGHTWIAVEHAGESTDKDFYDPKKRWR